MRKSKNSLLLLLGLTNMGVDMKLVRKNTDIVRYSWRIRKTIMILRKDFVSGSSM